MLIEAIGLLLITVADLIEALVAPMPTETKGVTVVLTTAFGLAVLAVRWEVNQKLNEVQTTLAHLPADINELMKGFDEKIKIDEPARVISTLMDCISEVQSRGVIQATQHVIRREQLTTWNQPGMRAYYQIGLNAVKRGVHLHRLFILSHESIWDSSSNDFDQTCVSVINKQASDGIEVRVLKSQFGGRLAGIATPP